MRAHATARLIGLDGNSVGRADLAQTPRGVLIEIDLKTITPGAHAIHIHSRGICDPKDKFVSAGPHLSLSPAVLTPHAHGYFARGGPDEGDLPNQFAASDGSLRASMISNAFTLGKGEKSIFGPQGASIVVDSGPDDYVSQPGGRSGPAIACGVIVRASRR
jgi:Cu-Zn family superoxide dismutase